MTSTSTEDVNGVIRDTYSPWEFCRKTGSVGVDRASCDIVVTALVNQMRYQDMRAIGCITREKHALRIDWDQLITQDANFLVSEPLVRHSQSIVNPGNDCQDFVVFKKRMLNFWFRSGGSTDGFILVSAMPEAFEYAETMAHAVADCLLATFYPTTIRLRYLESVIDQLDGHAAIMQRKSGATMLVDVQYVSVTPEGDSIGLHEWTADAWSPMITVDAADITFIERSEQKIRSAPR